MNIEENISLLEERIGYTFKDKNYPRAALTHSSYKNELKINKCEDYQRLEFLGDAVLELVVSKYLFNQNPDMQEGKLSKKRASMVCESALAFCANELNLGELIMLGKGEDSTGGRFRASILSDIFEAIIGAVYLDGGIEAATNHINKFHLNGIVEQQLFVDSKSVLQERIQEKPGCVCEYRLISESGPDHNKVFEVAVFIDGVQLAIATGRNKKEAEQKCAYHALKNLDDK